jgi:hypothetical protein
LNLFQEKLRDVFLAVLPVTLLVLLLHLTLTPVGGLLLASFLVGSVLIILGLTLFLVGVDLGVSPLGALIGPLITRRHKLWIVVASGLVLGFFISYAEPGLMILSTQIEGLSGGALGANTILITVSIGIAVMMVVGFLRILFNIPLFILLNVSYLFVLALSLLVTPEFLAIAFDTSGATTGVLAVPFILALSLGFTSRKKNQRASEKDSFGLVAITSVGAILSVLLLDVLTPAQSFVPPAATTPNVPISFAAHILGQFGGAIRDSLVAFIPLLVIFLVVNLISRDISFTKRRRMFLGFLYAFAGLSLFFAGSHAGFMDLGAYLGSTLTGFDSSAWLIGIGFVLGIVTILAEPAVYVLTHQIEEVTAGYVKRWSVLVALSLGVGIAVALSMLRIVTPAIQLWHYLLPGYILASALSFFVPKLFVGIAFDAGGVATGPMTATFILALTNGAANAHETANVLIDGFGMIAMVALMPIITLELLGLMFRVKTRRKEVKTHVS